LLTELAKEGRTVILTIHQNRSDLSESNVLLLARGGQVAYSGPGKDVLTHFKNAGFECPIQADPADFMLDLITIDLRHGTREADTRKRADELISTWSANAAANRTTSEISTGASNAKENAFCARPMAPFMVAFPTLYRRSMLNLWRERNALVARIMNIVPYGALIALFFAPLHTDYQALLTRMGLIQLYCFLYYMGTLNNVAHLPLEKRVLDQEIEERAYSPIPFFASFTLIELPLTIVASLIMTTIATFPLGIKSAEVFLSMSFDSFALITCGESLALAMNSVISDSRLTLSITNIFISIAQTMAGILNVNMPTWLQRVNYISPLTYVSRNLMPYFFRGVTFDCNPEDVLSSGACRKIHGDDILRLYRFNYDPKVQLAILAGVVVGYRVFAFLVLCLAKRSWR
jgi:ABC-type multidrug transport system permease subunit